MTTNNGRATRNGEHSQAVKPQTPEDLLRQHRVPKRHWDAFNSLMPMMHALERKKSFEEGIEQWKEERSDGYDKRRRFSEKFDRVICFNTMDHLEALAFRETKDGYELCLINDLSIEPIEPRQALEWWALMDEASAHFELDVTSDLGVASRFFKLLQRRLVDSDVK